MRAFRKSVFRHVLLALLPALLSIPAVGKGVSNDPGSVRLEVRDIVLLEQILQRIERGEVQDTAAVIENEYLASATVGLKPYAERYEVSGDGLATAMSMNP